MAHTPPGGRVTPLRRPRLGLWVLLGFIALSLIGQPVPLYTDWLWFQEVGFTSVFTTRLTLSGWLFLGMGAAVFVFLFINLSVAARTALGRGRYDPWCVNIDAEYHESGAAA